MAGPGYKAAKEMVRDDDRRPIHANLGGALNSLVGVRGAHISNMSETFGADAARRGGGFARSSLGWHI